MDTIKYYPHFCNNKHLNPYKRGQIALLLNDGLFPYAIAKKINCSPHTIGSEILRGSVPHIKSGNLVSIYFPDVAERNYLDNRKLCRPRAC